MATTTTRPRVTAQTVVIAAMAGIGFGHWVIPTHDLAPIQTTAAQTAISTPAATPAPH
jgi:hypothetical protein